MGSSWDSIFMTFQNFFKFLIRFYHVFNFTPKKFSKIMSKTVQTNIDNLFRIDKFRMGSISNLIGDLT